MHIGEWLATGTDTLRRNDIASARLDCLIMLEDQLIKDRSWVLAHPEHLLADADVQALSSALRRRTTHEPLAYIRGQSEFYGRVFHVDERVLEPRPESEDIITIATQIAFGLEYPATIVDVGTGSGALAISASLEIPSSTVFGTDRQPECLEVARDNAKRLGADVSFYKADLLIPADAVMDSQTRVPYGQADIILANLPYVPDGFDINRAAGFEPAVALFGGPDGLDLFRTLLQQLASLEKPARHVITESLPISHDALSALCTTYGYALEQHSGHVQHFSRR